MSGFVPGANVDTFILNVGRVYCHDCVRALRRFIGGLKGVESVDVKDGAVAVRFNPDLVDESFIRKVTRESVEKLGYSIED